MRPMLLTDSGLETVLIFQDGLDLPEFAAFVLLAEESGREALRRYYREHLDIAARYGVGFVLETPTWRASRHWGDRLGYSAEGLADANRQAVELVREVGAGYASTVDPILISGCIGPSADGYDGGLTAVEARDYHRGQVAVLSAAGVDRLCAMTLTHAEEAIGLTLAAAEAGAPMVISFTVETDGRLASGMPLGDAIEAVDSATGGGPDHYMINCAHPSHVEPALTAGAGWLSRIHAIRANASSLSHAEQDEAADLDAGDPDDLARRYARLTERLPLSLLGGCCGTDTRHIEAIAAACLPRPAGPGYAGAAAAGA
jgi:homocysteine S-methyltransferase